MGLSAESAQCQIQEQEKEAVRYCAGLALQKQNPEEKIVALAGNPNVGKSTVFNQMTGLRQHTGNWPGKTVTNAQGHSRRREHNFLFVDLPGTYSLMAHSAEEEAARDFICFSQADAVIVVCDATCLERSLNLVLQTMEITSRVVVCVNLMDEAAKKRLTLRLGLLEQRLGVPVAGVSARSGKGLEQLMELTGRTAAASEGGLSPEEAEPASLQSLSQVERAERPLVRYIEPVERAISLVEAAAEPLLRNRPRLSCRWVSLQLLERDPSLLRGLQDFLGFDLTAEPQVEAALEQASDLLAQAGLDAGRLEDAVASALVETAEDLCREVVTAPAVPASKTVRDRKLDWLFTSKQTGIPIMLLLLAVVFWITITGANYPSQLLSNLLFSLEEPLAEVLTRVGLPSGMVLALTEGMYRVLAWVVSVMLPPMAIFFPLFTLLEDFGYLPRVAFNLDHAFKKACTCGKQSLTMCMGFGCNAAGVTGCRIIDSPRERLIAVLTNSFVPCNGRFPTLITILTMFFIGAAGGLLASVWSALLLMALIVLGVLMTFGASRLLSKTLLKGVPSSFALELPPYRRPQVGKVIVRSSLDRTVFVLGRAVAVAAPAGVIIWLMANLTWGDATLLSRCSAFLDPFAQLLGLDGVILLAFILGFPANEIVVPIIIMAYLSSGGLLEMDNLLELKTLLLDNGWTWLTALNVMLFSLFHWPCSTTLLTIRRETKSWKWTAVSFLLPTLAGILLCMLTNGLVSLVSLAGLA